MAEATEKYFPFDSAYSGGAYDREYKAEDFARYYSAFVTSGVFMNDAASLQVTSGGGMQIKIDPGAAIINGYRYDNTTEQNRTLTAADGLLSRIDRIVIRWDKEAREIYAAVLEGELSDEPTAPEITRNSDIIEYAIADIRIAAGVTEITQSAITDQRMNSALCGMALPWAELDTSTLALQYETWVKEATAAGDAAALALLEEMRDILDGSAAGHLQNELDDEALRRRGYEGETTVFFTDGSVVTTDEDGAETTTTFHEDGSVSTMRISATGIVEAESTTVFNADGSITTTAQRYGKEGKL